MSKEAGGGGGSIFGPRRRRRFKKMTASLPLVRILFTEDLDISKYFTLEAKSALFSKNVTVLTESLESIGSTPH